MPIARAVRCPLHPITLLISMYRLEYLTRLRRELFDLRCQSTTEKVQDNSRIGKARKDLARVLTESTARRASTN